MSAEEARERNVALGYDQRPTFEDEPGEPIILAAYRVRIMGPEGWPGFSGTDEGVRMLGGALSEAEENVSDLLPEGCCAVVLTCPPSCPIRRRGCCGTSDASGLWGRRRLRPARRGSCRPRGWRRRAPPRNLTAARKVTKYQLCDRHAPWFAGDTRSRIIECLNEGGPGGWSPGCEGGRCRIWPGTDYHVPEACHGEMELDWTVSP